MSAGALFSDDTCFAEAFRDKVAAIFDHFDKDNDGHLNFSEIGQLQLVTSGTVMTEDQYVMVCRTLQCHPTEGLNLDMLRLTYASEGADVHCDYEKVFAALSMSNEDDKGESKQEEKVYEAGAEGFDIS